MEFTIPVGTAEKHDVHLHFNQWFGQVRIAVDGEDAAGDWRLFTLRTTRRYEFPVGQEERHDVVIEKERKGILGGFRDQTCRVLVDGEPVGTYVGSMTGRTTQV
ncbi:MAG TPA: hypothetical protein VIC86_06360 [Acidimicrobiales bacterium]|jgi:hypothetical protein